MTTPMRRFLLAASLLCVLTASAYAQPINQTARRMQSGTALPATCFSSVMVRDIFLLTSGTTGIYTCTAANTWTISASGASYPQLAPNGTAAAPSYSFTNSAGTGMFLDSANVLAFATGGVERWVINASGALVPLVNNTYDIGNSIVNPRDISAARDVFVGHILSFGGSIVVADLSDNELGFVSGVGPTFQDGGSLNMLRLNISGFGGTTKTWVLPNASSTVVGTDTTQTVSGKTLTAPIVGGSAFASLGTPTNGTLIYCTDCTQANPCAGGGSGAQAVRINGAWSCTAGAVSSAAPFADSTAIIKDDADATKTVTIDAGGITTANNTTIFAAGTAAAPTVRTVGSFIAGVRYGFGTGLTASDFSLIVESNMLEFGTGNLVSGVSGSFLQMKAASFVPTGPVGMIFNTTRELRNSISNSGNGVAVTTTGFSNYTNFDTAYLGIYGSSNTTRDLAISRVASGIAAIGNGNEGDATSWLQTAGACFVTADQTNATTTFASTTCSMTVKATRKYSGICELYLSDSIAADGAKIDFNGGSATSTNFIAQVTAFDTALNLSSQSSSISTVLTASTFTGAGAFEVHFSFESNAAGTFIPQFAQAAHTTGTITLKRGSNCRMTDMQ